MTPAIDIIRCLRNKKGHEFVTLSKVALKTDSSTVMLSYAIDKAWSMAPGSKLVYLTNEMIVPYLPAEMSQESQMAIASLLTQTSFFYETSKALEIAYTVVGESQLNAVLEQSFQEGSTSLERAEALRNGFAKLADLDTIMKKIGAGEVEDTNFVLLTPDTDLETMRPPGGGTRVCAFFGGDMDITLGGGLETGTYTILLGSKGEGKTWSSASIAARNARVGKKVLFITMENSKYSVSDRTYPLYLECPFFIGSFDTFRKRMVQELHRAPTVSHKMIKEFIDRLTMGQINPDVATWKQVIEVEMLKQNWDMGLHDAMKQMADPFYIALDGYKKTRERHLVKGGMIDVRFFPSNTLRISDIEQIFEESQDGYDLIIIDYLNTIEVPPRATKHEHLGWFSNEVRRLSAQRQCASIINAQLKRGFKTYVKHNALDEEIFIDFVAESFAAVWGADAVVVLMTSNSISKGVNTNKPGFVSWDRKLLLSRAREVQGGSWFNFRIDFGTGISEIQKVSL